MQTVTEKFDSLASAYLAAHQFELEGKCAVVLDECMGSLYPPGGIRGIRVVTFTSADPDVQDVFAQAAPLIEEKETQPADISPLTFVGLSCVTGIVIWTVFGLLFALIIVTDFSDQVRHLPLREMLSWKIVEQFLAALRQAGDVVIWSSIEGVISGALAAPILGVGLLVLKFRDSHLLAKYIIGLICFVLLAVMLIT